MNLIYDRTQSDLKNNTEKAYISYSDLNRIEKAMQELADELANITFKPLLNLKTNWVITDFRTTGDMARLKDNLNIIRNCLSNFSDMPDVPLAVEFKSIEEANNIEKIIAYKHRDFQRAAVAQRYCGDFYCGENWGDLSGFQG